MKNGIYNKNALPLRYQFIINILKVVKKESVQRMRAKSILISISGCEHNPQPGD